MTMLVSLDYINNADIEVGNLIIVVAVTAANVVNDIRENIRNLVGGEMTHYEKLIESTVERALIKLEQKAKQNNYDGVLGVKLSHPHVVDGGVEIIAYGNGFTQRKT